MGDQKQGGGMDRDKNQMGQGQQGGQQGNWDQQQRDQQQKTDRQQQTQRKDQDPARKQGGQNEADQGRDDLGRRQDRDRDQQR